MSGVETAAGLALAVLPLMISATDHYERCLRPFMRYRNFAKEADFFCWSFSVEQQRFRNQCTILLRKISERDAASIVLSGTGQPSLIDGEMAKRLEDLLGESKESCVATMERIRSKLFDIELAIKELGKTVDQERQKSENSVGDNHWRARVQRKILFSFKESSQLAQSLKELQTLNTAFTTCSDQSIRLLPTRTNVTKAQDSGAAQKIDSYKTFGRAACQAYEALSKSCTRHPEHQAHFCVESVQATIGRDKDSQISFNLAFGDLNVASCADTGDLVWFVVSTLNGEGTNKSGNNLVLRLKSGPSTDSEERINTVSLTQEKKRKRVTFRLSPPASAPQLEPPSIADSVTPNTRTIEDLCEYLGHFSIRPDLQNACLDLVEKTGSCRTSIYPSSSASSSQHCRSTTLRLLVSSMSKQGANGQTFLLERIRLAKTLAIAVLQYHATPWLGMSWNKDSLLFFGPENMSPLQAWQLNSSPHLSVRVRGQSGQHVHDLTDPLPKLARNSLLFSLAVILLEIAHSSTLESLQQPIDLVPGQESYTEFFVARRLSRSNYTDLGPRYHSIIERLVECDFGCGDDLENFQLQTAIHKEVICPLESLEQRLRVLYHDP